MLRLKNISQTDKFLEADLFAESDTEPSHIVINKATREVERVEEGPSYWEMHVSHAKRVPLEIANTGDTRSERRIAWY